MCIKYCNGKIKYESGDIYKGRVKDGKHHGHGELKQGRIGTSSLTVAHYVGDWSHGLRHGYGVLNKDVEKYMGMWASDMKNGSGCVVTHDDIYYEGTSPNVFLMGYDFFVTYKH